VHHEIVTRLVSGSSARIKGTLAQSSSLFWDDIREGLDFDMNYWYSGATLAVKYAAQSRGHWSDLCQYSKMCRGCVLYSACNCAGTVSRCRLPKASWSCRARAQDTGSEQVPVTISPGWKSYDSQTRGRSCLMSPLFPWHLVIIQE